VGVMGDDRTYEHVCALRAVTSTDGMTADSYPFEHAFLARVATRIINEVRGINRVTQAKTKSCRRLTRGRLTSGSGRCRAAGRAAHRNSANLSVAAHHRNRACPCRRRRGRGCATPGGADERVAQPIIIENVSGADGSIGTGRAARARPDGYTIVLGFLGSHVLNGAFYSLQYDVLNDFAPVSPLFTTSLFFLERKRCLGKT
jgi:hypothetical protein